MFPTSLNKEVAQNGLKIIRNKRKIIHVSDEKTVKKYCYH